MQGRASRQESRPWMHVYKEDLRAELSQRLLDPQALGRLRSLLVEINIELMHSFDQFCMQSCVRAIGEWEGHSAIYIDTVPQHYQAESLF